jgi:integrase
VQFRNRRGRRGRGRSSEPRFIGHEDVSRMLAHLELLGAPTTAQLAIERPGLEPLTARGLGDAQAMRAWLLQAMTGRRASEILMLDFQPLTALPDIDLEAAGEDDFVARLRYQQTKIDGVDPTILVERSVVNIIAEQQAYAAARFPGAALRYLFPALRHNHQGMIARTYKSYRFALRRLDKLVGLSDSAGTALSYTHTHRLRHTRATELINAGVPLHVVQRYLGHRSPEMTLHYAATLAATAEAQFLKFKKVGSDGRELALSGRDLFDMIALDKRTDRVLPNGWCLLPPTKTCEKGNACLPCGHFATDASHRDELVGQHRRTLNLIEVRQGQHQQRHGAPMGEENIWLTGRRRELASLDAILARLDQHDGAGAAVRGAGAPGQSTAADQQDRGTQQVAG